MGGWVLLIGRIWVTVWRKICPLLLMIGGPVEFWVALDTGYLSVLLTRLVVGAPLLTLCGCLEMQDLPHANRSYNPLMYSFW